MELLASFGTAEGFGEGWGYAEMPFVKPRFMRRASGRGAHSRCKGESKAQKVREYARMQSCGEARWTARMAAKSYELSSGRH
jgi:hypothetical protein